MISKTLIAAASACLALSCATTAAFETPAGRPASGKVKVFILSGQSNMEGKAKLSLLEHQIQAPETRDLFKHLRKDGKWVEREDVWITYLDREGPLSVSYGARAEMIGPELGFGWVVGKAWKNQFKRFNNRVRRPPAFFRTP